MKWAGGYADFVSTMQSMQGNQVEVIQAKVASLEAAMLQARGEAKAAGQRAEDLAQQLSSAEDAVKVRMLLGWFILMFSVTPCGHKLSEYPCEKLIRCTCFQDIPSRAKHAGIP